MLKVCLVKTSVSSAADAELIAKGLIDLKLAACVHISSGTSLYRWQEKIEQEAEQQLVIKTTPAGRSAVVKFLRDNHPYTLPEIVWSEFETTEGYGNWVDAEVAAQESSND